MLRKMMIATTALTVCTASVVSAQSVDGAKFRDVEEGTWYHSIEIETLVKAGADEAELVQTLKNISNATGVRSNPDQPDTVIAYGPGNWAYEFTAAGDAAVEREDYAAAVTYYHTGAAPHTGAPGQAKALEKARDAYEEAMEDISDYEEVEIDFDGREFTAYLHVPQGKGPFPVLVMSNGSDMSSVTTLDYYTQSLMPKGIALLTIDVPGLGSSSEYTVADGNTEKLHVAAINWAKDDDRLDNNNVFMQGISFAGNAAARIWTQHQDLDLAGVVYTCGPLNAAFMAPSQAYAHFPQLTIDGVKVRLGQTTDASFEDFADAARVLAVNTIGAFEGDMIDTPILAINTNDDPVAPVEEMDKLLARATNAERVVFDLPGHCPPRDKREAIASSWIEANLR